MGNVCLGWKIGMGSKLPYSLVPHSFASAVLFFSKQKRSQGILNQSWGTGMQNLLAKITNISLIQQGILSRIYFVYQ